ncbi:MAG: hypothetical protein WC370_04925 [Dehalococcoidales bacterium]|jgi:hypothetical protein
MLKISRESKIKPEEAIKRAVAFFGPEGYGLEVKDEGGCCVSFEGGGGGIDISAAASQKGSVVDIESREWDYQAQQFLDKLK